MNVLDRGISFEIPNEYGNWLGKILKPINGANCNWLVGEGTEIVGGSGEEWGNDALGNLDGLTLQKHLRRSDYYVIFADLKAFPSDEPAVDIASYEEFQSSSCEFVILIVDSVYVIIYAKDPTKLEALYQNALENKVRNLERIRADNDARSRFSVW
ncbi:DUF2691 family protein [Planococcus sp. FY231025]|uniref:DUF2691 family protein n=1 Tax=Planococcus sp. FY231025 TaxID=3455699 RepID=UPI003F8FB5B2